MKWRWSDSVDANSADSMRVTWVLDQRGGCTTQKTDPIRRFLRIEN